MIIGQNVKQKIFITLAVLFFNTSIEANNFDAKQCALIENSNTRLDCYDGLFKESSYANEIPITSTSKATTESRQNTQKDLSPSPREINITELQLEKKKERIDEEKTFGFKRKKIEAPKPLKSKIIKVEKLNSYKLNIILDNGQIWRTVESIYKIKVRKNQEITITKDLIFNGYILRVNDRKIALRVRRIK